MEFLNSLNSISNDVLYTLIMLFLLFYLLQSNSNKFVRGVFITAFILSLVDVSNDYFGPILTSILGENPVKNSIIIYLIFSVPHILSKYLFFVGLTFLIGRSSRIKNNDKLSLVGKKRSIGFHLLLFIITAGLYFPFWLYGFVKNIKINFQDVKIYSPGRAVGFLFIPIFNIFWIFYLMITLPQAVSKIENKYYTSGIGFYFRPALISTLIIILMIITILNNIMSIDLDVISSACKQSLTLLQTIFLYIILQAKYNAFYEVNL